LGGGRKPRSITTRDWASKLSHSCSVKRRNPQITIVTRIPSQIPLYRHSGMLSRRVCSRLRIRDFGEANVAHRQRWKISTSSACVPKHIIMLHDGRRPSLQGRLLHSLHRVVTDRWLSESRVGSVRWLVLSAESHVGILQMVKGVSPTKGF
jgi:hypothetical protein